MTMFYQCRLRRGNVQTVGWIEERGAKVGNSVQLKTADNHFWEVLDVFTPGMDEDRLREKQANDRNALPSISPR